MPRPARPLHVLLPTLGSAGDVHPHIALALALTARGHRATILTNPLFAPLVESLGLGFRPVGTLADAEAIIADPDLWHPRRGFEVVARRVIVPALGEVYRLLEGLAAPDTVVAASSIALGARLAAERLGLPTATLHLQPAVIRSLADPGTVGEVGLSARQPRWLKRAFFYAVDRFGIDPILVPPLNALRAALGLAPLARPFRQWIHSPECVIGFFPEWFAPRQPDWPPHLHLVGFPLWDGAAAPLPPAAAAFLAAGPPPVLFTAGSAAATQSGFFRASASAARTLGVRAMLVSNFVAQLPRELPAGVAAFGYLPFSAVLPRAVAIVHHGGIGTLAQGLKAGIAQLVVPAGHDQFDNGARLERLGAGQVLPQSRYTARRAVAALGALLADDRLRERGAALARCIDSDGALARACALLEQLAGPVASVAAGPAPAAHA